MAASRQERMKGLYDALVHPSTQSKAGADAEVRAKPDAQAVVEQETPTEANSQPEVHVDAHSHTQASTQTYTDADLRDRMKSGAKRPKLEDERRRQTYWLHPEEIKIVEELAAASGLTKYEVVGTALRELYRRVTEAD